MEVIDSEYKYEAALSAAEQTLAMHRELVRLRDENEELRDYRQRYIDLLNSSISTGQEMSANILRLVMVPGVAEACAKHAKKVKA